MDLPIKAMVTASIRSGTYGGSTEREVFPSTFSYSRFSLDEHSDPELRETFTRLMQAYLATTLVNGDLTLQAYLALLHAGDTARLQDVHALQQEKQALGSVHQPLSTLFFVDDAQGTVLRVDPYQTRLSWNEAADALNTFMREHATHVTTGMLDEFYNKYYNQ